MAVRFPVRHSTRQVESTARSPGAVRPEAFDREALAQFASVRRAAWRLTRNVPEAEDLVQETYVRALRAFRHFRSGTNLKAWRLTILRDAEPGFQGPHGQRGPRRPRIRHGPGSAVDARAHRRRGHRTVTEPRSTRELQNASYTSLQHIR